ncbi:MAG TPA: tetratricopeptide repeat protein [Steroidobacteraceae bacterium]|nr:tetratricopeptide repeat protein [Steroidobacteraceae bacterium]
MHAWKRLLAISLISAAAVPAHAALPRCPGGDTWQLVVDAEQALALADWPEATRLYACAAAKSSDPALAERATRTAYENHQLKRAVTAARRWRELAPDSEVARRHLATSLLRLYDDEAAGLEFAKLLNTSYADRARGYIVLLGILAEEQNETGAARVMGRLATADPGSAEAQYAAAVLWLRADDAGRALAAARRALDLRPRWRMAELVVVGAESKLGRHEDALATAARLAADGDPHSQLSHAWLLLENDRRDEAAQVFEDLRRPGGAAAGDALDGLAAIALEERRFDDAERLLNEAVRDPKQLDLAQWRLAGMAEERGERADAARKYQRITTGPRAVVSQLRAYRLWRELGETERAELLIDDYLAMSPADTREIVSGVASILVEEGRGEEAIGLIDRAYARLPDDGLLLARAFLLERLDRVPEAVVEMRRVLARRRADPVVQNALGYTLVDRTRSIAEGHRLIKAALAAQPDSYAIQDSMGWALVRLGRLEEGKVWLENAWKNSEDPEVAAHLGETLWLMGRIDEARRIWDEALRQNPDSRPLLRTIERHPK